MSRAGFVRCSSVFCTSGSFLLVEESPNDEPIEVRAALRTDSRSLAHGPADEHYVDKGHGNSHMIRIYIVFEAARRRKSFITLRRVPRHRQRRRAAPRRAGDDGCYRDRSAG